MEKIGKLGKLGGGWLKSGGKKCSNREKMGGWVFFGQCSFLSIRAAIFVLTPPPCLESFFLQNQPKSFG